MLAVPVTLTRLIVKLVPFFSKRAWEHVEVLVVGALLALSYGESQWVALALRDATGRDSLGGACLGFTVSHHVMSLGALSSATEPTPQVVVRVGRATGWPDPSSDKTPSCSHSKDLYMRHHV